MTPNLQVVRNYIALLPSYAYVKKIGVTNCRKIAGSQTYSQHSWSNAMDIHFTDSVTIPAKGAALAAGNDMKAAILATFEPHIYEMIWQSTGHYDHIHVSTWPKGYLTPPCAGGAQRIKYENGTWEYAPFPLTITNEGDDEVQSLRNQVAEAISKGWLGWPDEGTWWLNLCEFPNDPQWSDFEAMWNREKANEWALIQRGLNEPAPAPAPAPGTTDETARSMAQKALDALVRGAAALKP